MLSAHRRHSPDTKIFIVMSSGTDPSLHMLYSLTNGKTLELPASSYVRGKIKIIRWYQDPGISSETSVSPTLTPLSIIRKVLTYTEPKYMPWMNTYLNIHQNQYDAAKEIIDYFAAGCYDVILAAEMQSGKSGTIRYLIHHLLHVSGNDDRWESHMKPENVFFICGMNDNDLRRQACMEFSSTYELLKTDNILFSKQLQTWNGDPNMVSVVIVDESHYAAQVSSQVDKFFRKLQSRTNKFPLHIVSVSATPMAEIASMSNHQDKGIVYLKPGSDYYGISDLFNAGLIYQSINITDNMNGFCDLLCQEYEYQNDHSMKKYNIVRLPSQWYYQDLEDQIRGLDLDIEIINYHSTCQQDMLDFNNLINIPPPKFTLIWIYGTLRAGKQLNTQHIGFVHDTASSRPDTIAQSLLGRILGYGKARHRVKCFTDLESANLIRIWFNGMFDSTRIPRKSNAILDGYNGESTKWALHPSIGVMLDPETTAHYRALKQEFGNRYPYKWDFFADVLAAADGVNKAELQRILTDYEISPSGGLTILTETNAPRSFAEHWISYYYYHLQEKAVRGFDVVGLESGSYYHIYANLNIESLQYGYVLVCYKEYVNDDIGREHTRVSSKSRYYRV